MMDTLNREAVLTHPGAVTPASIVGAENVEALHAAGFRIVPSKSTKAMRKAAAETLGHWQPGSAWFTSYQKAGLRYEAMLAAWRGDFIGMNKWREPKSRWHWKIGKWFELAIGWGGHR